MDEAKKKMTGTPVIFFSFCGGVPSGSVPGWGCMAGKQRRNASPLSEKEKPAAAATGSSGSELPI